MLLLRLLQKPDRAPRFGRVLDDEPEVVELLDGDPLLGGRPTGERFAYTPKEWQDDPDGSEVELLVPVFITCASIRSRWMWARWPMP